MAGAAGRLCGWLADKVIWGLFLTVQVLVVQLGAGEVRGLGGAGTSLSQSLPFCEGGIELKVPLSRGPHLHHSKAPRFTLLGIGRDGCSGTH